MAKITVEVPDGTTEEDVQTALEDQKARKLKVGSKKLRAKAHRQALKRLARAHPKDYETFLAEERRKVEEEEKLK